MSFASVKGAPLGLVSVTTLPSQVIPNTNNVFAASVQPGANLFNIYAGSLPQGTHLLTANFTVSSTNGSVGFLATTSIDNQVVSTTWFPCYQLIAPSIGTYNIVAICPSYREGATVTINVQAQQQTGSPPSVTFSGTISTVRII